MIAMWMAAAPNYGRRRAHVAWSRRMWSRITSSKEQS